jgi:hypothetical protein
LLKDDLPITYRGGPIMKKIPDVYLIWYGTWSASDKLIITDMLNNIGGSPYYRINRTYWDSTGVRVPNGVHIVGQVNDNYSRGTALADSDIWTLVFNYTEGVFYREPDAVYFVFTSADVTLPGFCATNCGWHTSRTYAGIDVKYSFVGNPDQCPTACEAHTGTTPNGSAAMDAMVSVVAHELEETVTDPDINAWIDANNQENADKCAWTFGTTYTTPNGGTANMRLGNRDFLIQRNWFQVPDEGYCALSNRDNNPLTRRNDLDGDNRTDFVMYRPSNATWYARLRAGGSLSSQLLGSSVDTPNPGDFDGDGTTDWAWFRPDIGRWTAVFRGIGGTFFGQGVTANWGVSTDIRVPGDYDGDGRWDWAVWRPSNGTWFVHPRNGGPDITMQWGVSTDKPVSGDFDRDFQTDFAVWRPSNGTWFVRPRNGGPDFSMQWGASTDKPVSGDFDGDGQTDFAVWRPSNGTWYVRPRNGLPDITQQWGQSGDRPVPGDYDGDNVTDWAVFRPSNATWYVHTSTPGPDIVVTVPSGMGSDLTPYP